jgi:branched-chain amino acid transport system ATP-binding protein
MLECRALQAAYGGIQALSSVDLTVGEGEVVCLLGANGAGKSTLLGALTASVPATVSGSIRFMGTELAGAGTDEIVRAGIALVPEGRQLFGELTVLENLRMGAYLRRDRDGVAADLERVQALFPRLRERSRQLAATLSGGEQQMVAIGRALMCRPRLLLLDEPSLGLAPLLVREIMQLVRRINESGVSVLLVEQNARQALRISRRAYLLEKGRIVGSGEAAGMLGDARIVSAYLGETSH